MTTCACGGIMRLATRYEATRTTSVSICWSCGAEDPPCCDRPTYERNGAAYGIAAECPTCGETFPQRIAGSPIYCSLRCRPLSATAFKRRAS